MPDGTGDKEYLAALESGIQLANELFAADLVIYLAGADPYQDDRLGRLSLSKLGLARRDRHVFEFCQRLRLPIAVVMSGGYGRQIEDTADIHFATVKVAQDIFGMSP